MSRFFLNLRSVAYDNPQLASQTTTGFALDNTSPRTFMTRIMRRKPEQNTKRTTEDARTTTRRVDEEGVVDTLGDHVSIAYGDCAAASEVVELRPTERGRALA
jgi:hypothetical protein